MQEDERLLPEDDEDGVAEFRNLGQDKEERPKSGNAVVLDEAEKGTSYDFKKDPENARNLPFPGFVAKLWILVS